MSAAIRVSELLRADPTRWRLLGVVAGLDLPDCWIGAGFVRNAVWQHLHGRAEMPLEGDVDVIWYNPDCVDAAEGRRLEAQLAQLESPFAWSVKIRRACTRATATALILHHPTQWPLA